MASGDKILSGDYNDLYTRLNAARQRVGMGAIAFTPAKSGDTAASAGMLQFKTDVATSRTNKYLANSVAYNPGDTLNVGQKILYTNLTLAQATLTSMQSVCVNDSVNGTNSTFSTNSTFGDFGDNSNFGNNSTCSNNRVNSVNSSNFSTHGGSNTQFGSA